LYFQLFFLKRQKLSEDDLPWSERIARAAGNSPLPFLGEGPGVRALPRGAADASKKSLLRLFDPVFLHFQTQSISVNPQ